MKGRVGHNLGHSVICQQSYVQVVRVSLLLPNTCLLVCYPTQVYIHGYPIPYQETHLLNYRIIVAMAGGACPTCSIYSATIFILL